MELGTEKWRVEGDARVYAYQAPPLEMWGNGRMAHEMGVGVEAGLRVRKRMGWERVWGWVCGSVMLLMLL